MNIEHGIKPGPAKVVIYGPEGIGKTTFASKFPKPLFLDLDNGSSRLDVARVAGLDSYPLVKAALTELSKDPQGYQTIVIDTGDKLEALVIESVLNEVSKGDGKTATGIEDYGYGKGYTYVKERIAKFLDTLSLIQAKTGLNVVIVCHAWQRKVEQPGETNNYDHYELKLSKQAAPLLREWPDFLFFCNYDISIMKTSDGKSIATGGQRCVFTSHTPYYDAKTRAELPERLKLDEKGVAAILKAVFPAPSAQSAAIQEPPRTEPKPEPKPESKQEPKQEAKPETVPEPPKDNFVHTEQFDPQAAEDEAKKPLLEQLDALLKADGLTYADLELATSHPRINMRPKGTPIKAFSVRDLQRLVNGYDNVKKTINNLKK